MTRVEVAHPERWWLAVRSDMPWLKDPDVDDHHQRWEDRNDRDWAAIAAAVQHVMNELIAGRGRIEPIYEDDPSAGHHVVVDLDLDHLDATDQKIVTEWFWQGLGPIADPWDDGVVNGRHRLWNSWKAAPKAALPVESALLRYLDDVPHMNDDFGTSVYQGTMEGIELIPPTVLKRNRVFYTELRRVAGLGGHVDVMPCRRWSDGDRDLRDELDDDPNLLPHILAGIPMHRHDPKPPPGLHDVATAPAPVPWWRRVLTWLGGTR